MKKLFQVGDLKAIEALKSNNAMILIGRTGKQIWLQNLESEPKGALKFEFDPTKHELTIRVSLKDGEYLAIKDMPGIAEKKVL